MEEIEKNIYRIPVVLPGSPLKSVNSYLIRGGERNLLVDTGFHHPDSEAALRNGLEEIGVSMENTDIFLTHLHTDHAGLCGALKTPNTKVYIRACDGEMVNGYRHPEYWGSLLALQDNMGIPLQDRLDFRDNPIYKYNADADVEFTPVQDGTVLQVGAYRLEAVDLAGHTPGQLGLWCMEKQLLFCGDHILAKITPNITLWDFQADYLGIYLRNLKKVKTMGIRHLMTAHRQPVPDTNARIDELLAHHARRLDEICGILQEKAQQSVYEIAEQMHWDYGGGDFRKFPPEQKWFAASEVFAHTEHLRRMEKIGMEKDGECFRYTLKR